LIRKFGSHDSNQVVHRSLRGLIRWHKLPIVSGGHAAEANDRPSPVAFGCCRSYQIQQAGSHEILREEIDPERGLEVVPAERSRRLGELLESFARLVGNCIGLASAGGVDEDVNLLSLRLQPVDS
jgi:hypothetical protein